MTIKEIETLSGLPRANIRYYESEGLIAPKRAENGYREYSQADAEVLLRVKLLRALGLRIDTIKSLAAGTLMLGDAIDARLAELHAEQENLTPPGASPQDCGRRMRSFPRLTRRVILVSFSLRPRPRCGRM